MSANTVQKYVSELKNKRLIHTEPITVITMDGCKRNGTLRYYICPIKKTVDYYHEQQFCRLEMAVERQKAQTHCGCVQPRSCLYQQDGPMSQAA